MNQRRQQESGRVEGKVALITGAGSGIGQAIAQVFAGEGTRVMVTDCDLTAAQATVEAIQGAGGRAAAYWLDVTDEQQWIAVVDIAVEQWERLDIVVNNAGIAFAKPVTEMTLEEWRRVLAVNLDGVFLGTKHGVRGMRRSGGGNIINVASASGLKASPGASAYGASKAAVRMFAKAIALECAQQGDNIRVNTIYPSGVQTPIWEGMPFWQTLQTDQGSADAAWQALAQSVPLKRLATPEEIAHAALYLASDEARFVTGADLVIDGGFTA